MFLGQDRVTERMKETEREQQQEQLCVCLGSVVGRDHVCLNYISNTYIVQARLIPGKVGRCSSIK